MALVRKLSAFRHTATLALLFTLLASPAFAQGSPWERVAFQIQQTLTGPLAQALTMIGIFVGGVMFMFGEPGAKRNIAYICIGGSMMLFAGQFMTWLF